MRIIGGKKRGLKLCDVPKDVTCRPTGDKVKEALFDIIRFRAKGSFLDLFGGTGQIAIEAVSIGFDSAVIIDNSPASISLIRKNVDRSGFGSEITIIESDYKKYLKHTVADKQFDVIFIDPPYDTELAYKSLKYISESNILKEDGMVVVETAFEKTFDDSYSRLKKIKEYKYGTVKLITYTWGD